MKIALGSDHAGYALKEHLKAHLAQRGHTLVDFGCHSEAPSDYPDFVGPAAQALSRGEVEGALVFGGSGNGEAIVANKLPGVRCGLCWNLDSARLTKRHNNANALALGGRMLDLDTATQIVDLWLETAYEGGRHDARLAKITEWEQGRHDA